MDIEYQALWPVIIVAITSIVVLLQAAITRRHAVALGLTIVGLIAAFIAVIGVGPLLPQSVGVLLVMDGFAQFFMGLIIAAAIVTAVLGYAYLRRRNEQREEFYIVLLLATLGSMVLTAASHFVTFFLGLEILSVSLYVMIAYLTEELAALEAGVKYLILAAASSAFLLFGMALIYAEFGTMQFGPLADALAAAEDLSTPIVLVATALMLVGIGFKLAIVPFHVWTPDVYTGAPAPVTAFVASVSKSAVFALLLRYFFVTDGYQFDTVMIALAVIAIASMLIGNILALIQENVKRILAYSSIAHLGYMLVAFIAGGDRALEAVAYYLIVYSLAVLGSFGIISLISPEGRERMSLEDFRGLFWQRPRLAIIFTILLLSLAGIPVTAGFVGKFYLVLAGVAAAHWVLVVVLAIASLIGIYYYFRIMAVMYARRDTPAASTPTVSLSGATLLGLLAAATIYLGVYPDQLLLLIRRLVLTL
ncbi:NADH-quinone oxidoreductase subunit NuoN [candidate division GN15 bacterium]|nr:NADH-quinone oxidoreductase subunit NuoN [candidate division GN15 bacterium]